MTALRIDVWSDIACPWCWVGKRHLEAALKDDPAEVDVVWRAFELNPTAPPRPRNDRSYAERLSIKYGVPEAEGQAMLDRMTGVGDSVGLAFRFDRLQPTNTFDGHRLVHWALTEGRQDAMKERLFKAYMSEGRLLADHDVLVELAAEVGLPADEARRVLRDGAFAEDVRTDEQFARELGVSGVPFFVLGGRYAVTGAQPAEVLKGALAKAREDHPGPTATDDQAEAGCDADGCTMGEE